MDIKSDSMPERTERLFRKIAGFSSHPAFQKMILIGGTAMSIQCGHRLSEDLDFWSPTDTLEDCDIDGLIAALTKAGCATRLANRPIRARCLRATDINPVWGILVRLVMLDLIKIH